MLGNLTKGPLLESEILDKAFSFFIDLFKETLIDSMVIIGVIWSLLYIIQGEDGIIGRNKADLMDKRIKKAIDLGVSSATTKYTEYYIQRGSILYEALTEVVSH